MSRLLGRAGELGGLNKKCPGACAKREEKRVGITGGEKGESKEGNKSVEWGGD